MYSRWVNLAVVLLWLATMGWLVKSKVLPPLLVGDPPSYQTILDPQQREPPVGWRVAMNERTVGWALTTTTVQPDGLVEIGSHVHFDEVPLEELTPGWLRSLLRWVDKPSLQQAMDAKSVLFLDPLGRLTRFESTIGIGAAEDLLSLKGEVVGSQVMLSVRSGEFLYRSEVRLPARALTGDALQPQTRLPGLRQGQAWTVPVYSPLRPPNSPMEILHAEVEGHDLLLWEDRTERVWLVVYRDDPGAALGGRKETRGRLWVRRDGTVLKQEVSLFGSEITFSRVPQNEVAALEAIADAESRSEVRPEPTQVEHWPLHLPASPLHQSLPPVEPLPSPADHDPLR